MMRGLFIISILLSGHLMAQQTIVTGSVFVHERKEPIEGCHVLISGSDNGVVTDSDGRFTLRIEGYEYEYLVLEFDHLGYVPRTQKFDMTEIRSYDSVPVELGLIFLKGTSFQLPEVPISSERLPDVVYRSEKHSVSDYEFFEEGLLLLAYEKTLNKAAKIYQVSLEMEHLDSLPIPKGVKAVQFQRDYMGHVYLETVGALFLIVTDQTGLDMHQMDKQAYEEQITPVIDSSGNRLYFSTWFDRFPAFDYYGFGIADSSYQHIHQVADEFMLELCRAEFKYLNTRDKLKLFRLELATGVEKEVLACMTSYEEGLYYRPLYAPMFLWEEKVYLFDHPAETLFTFNTEGQPLDSLPINYHSPQRVLGNHFSRKLIMDEDNGEVYALFQKPGGACELVKIDKETGLLRGKTSLTYEYPSSIQLRNGEVYYTYRPFESMQKKYLYKEQVMD